MTGTDPAPRWRLLAISAVAVAIGMLPGWILLPGVVALPSLPGLRDTASLGAIGLVPYLSAVALVELVAAAVPRWRPLRVGGHEARAKLTRASMVLAAAFALFQGWMIAVQLEAIADGGVPAVAHPGLAFRAVAAASLAAASALRVWLAHAISVNGLGNGFSVLLGASAVRAVVERVLSHRGEVEAPAAALAGVACMAGAVALAWSAVGRPVRGGAVRLPVSGLDPLYTASSLLMLPATVAAFAPGVGGAADVLVPGSGLFEAVRAALVVALAIAYGLAYARPSKVAGGAQEVKQGIAQSAAMLLALLGLGIVAARVGLQVDLLSLVIVTAVARDLFEEWHARRGPVASVWPMHRVYAVGPALAALEARKIPAYARGLRHRSLIPFFGAFVPIEILVPEDRADDASAVIARRLENGT